MLSCELVILSIVSLASVVRASPPHDYSFDPHARSYHHPTFNRRDYVSPTQANAAYDYVIAGGGLAGLVLAARLSDDSNRTVLVLEAGPSGDDVAATINTPAETYYNSLLGSETYDWLYQSTPQANAGGRAMRQPRGKLVGGSSAVNGMYIVRPSEEEVQAWHDLIASTDSSAASAWNWDSFFTALKDTETFTPPTADAQSTAGMKYVTGSHGSSGKLHTTYPGYMVPVTGSWLPTLEAAGVSVSSDGYSGDNVGGFFSNLAINPTNWTRSYSKPAFIDSLPPRSNLHIISGATVERVIFADNVQNGNLVASAVEFSTGRGSEKRSIQVNKEAILCGGAMGSAQLLQLSGVGPRDVLEAAGVSVKLELPGVGQHFIDHLAAGVAWESNVDTQGTIRASGSDLSKTPEFNSFVNNGIAYINGSRLFGGDESFKTFQQQIASAAGTSASTLVPSQYSTVIEGYKAVYDVTVNKVMPTAGLIEILLSLNAPGQIMVQAAIQQPMSHGRIYINSSSVYDNIVIDPNYFSHPADIVILRQGLKLARSIGGTAPLSQALGNEVAPGAAVQSDEDIENWLRTNANTEFHPGGACAMLPKEQGGVVDASLKVYGTSNVRVVDSSVFPVSFSAHLMSPTYALAEKAATILSGTFNPSSPSTTTSTGNTTGTSAGIGSPSTTSSDGIVFRAPSWMWFAAALPAIFALL